MTNNTKRNKLKNVNKLSKFSNLKHICLDYNEISDLENLSCLLFLAKIDCSNNQIKNINLSFFRSLSYLAIEGNQIKSLSGFIECRELTQLCNNFITKDIGNNFITDLNSLFFLKGLLDLSILNLIGNQICSSLDYRLFAVFHLVNLKVVCSNKSFLTGSRSHQKNYNNLNSNILEN